MHVNNYPLYISNYILDKALLTVPLLAFFRFKNKDSDAALLLENAKCLSSDLLRVFQERTAILGPALDIETQRLTVITVKGKVAILGSSDALGNLAAPLLIRQDIRAERSVLIVNFLKSDVILNSIVEETILQNRLKDLVFTASDAISRLEEKGKVIAYLSPQDASRLANFGNLLTIHVLGRFCRAPNCVSYVTEVSEVTENTVVLLNPFNSQFRSYIPKKLSDICRALRNSCEGLFVLINDARIWVGYILEVSDPVLRITYANDGNCVSLSQVRANIMNKVPTKIFFGSLTKETNRSRSREIFNSDKRYLCISVKESEKSLKPKDLFKLIEEFRYLNLPVVKNTIDWVCNHFYFPSLTRVWTSHINIAYEHLSKIPLGDHLTRTTIKAIDILHELYGEEPILASFVKNVFLSALLHDSGKAYAKKGKEHPEVSVRIAKEEIGITESEILDAIANHHIPPNKIKSPLGRILTRADAEARMEELKKLEDQGYRVLNIEEAIDYWLNRHSTKGLEDLAEAEQARLFKIEGKKRPILREGKLFWCDPDLIALPLSRALLELEIESVVVALAWYKEPIKFYLAESLRKRGLLAYNIGKKFYARPVAIPIRDRDQKIIRHVSYTMIGWLSDYSA